MRLTADFKQNFETITMSQPNQLAITQLKKWEAKVKERFFQAKNELDNLTERQKNQEIDEEMQ